MYHKDIGKENKEKIEKIKIFIQKILKEKDYNDFKPIWNFKRRVDLSGRPINEISFKFNQDNVIYSISIGILDK